MRLGKLVRCGKINYATKIDALLAMARQEVSVTTGTAKLSKGYAPTRAYRCRRCLRWHLTSRGRRAANPVTPRPPAGRPA